MERTKLLIYIVIALAVLILVIKYWKTGQKK